MTSRPEVIFFDLAFTLIYPQPSVGHVYARVAEDFGSEADPVKLNDAFAKAWETVTASRSPADVASEGKDGRPFWRRIVEKTFSLSGFDMPDDPYFDTVYDLFAKAECWGIYEDVLPAFDAVERRGLRSGILSNFDERLRPLLENLSLSSRIELIVTSAEAGVEKPHPGIFEVAGRLAGSEPRSLALIGDSLEADYFGARRAGWSSCVVDRDGGRHGRQVASFSDLVSCVEYLAP